MVGSAVIFTSIVGVLQRGLGIDAEDGRIRSRELVRVE